MNSANKEKKKFIGRMLFQMIMIVLIVLFVSYICLYILLKIMVLSGNIVIKAPEKPIHPISANFILIFIAFVSTVIGLIISIYLSRRFLKPIEELKKATEKVANGDFDIKIKKIPLNEMGELVENFNIMVSELKKNETLKSDFISNVSHEFKTPLSSIQGYATLLQDDTLCEEDRNKYINYVIQSTTKLTTLVNNILKITKIDNQKISIDNKPYQLDEQIRESVLFFEKEWNEKNLELDIDLDKVVITADEVLLSNVWNNLISNAIKYSHPNGKIRIRLEKKENQVEVKIKDNGIGIAEESLPYIFDKFYQADKSHSGEGNGLGLSLSKKIVLLSKGNISVTSKLNEGSEFTVILPL